MNAKHASIKDPCDPKHGCSGHTKALMVQLCRREFNGDAAMFAKGKPSKKWCMQACAPATNCLHHGWIFFGWVNFYDSM